MGRHERRADRITGDAIVTYTTRDGLPDNHVNALWEDRDGSLWIGTAKGLVKRVAGTFVTYTTARRAPEQRRDLALRRRGKAASGSAPTAA